MKQKIDSMADQFDCGICYMIMHQAVSLMPCLHSYCGSCFSDWMGRSKECPNCREAVNEVKKNSMLNSVLHNYCGGCFSDWLKRSKDCPSCREVVIMVKKNPQVNSTIESYLLVNP